jgi:hypothetical protein
MGEKTVIDAWGEKTVIDAWWEVGAKPKEEILKMLGDGPDAHIHHQPGTIFDMARLFLTIHQEELHEQWLKEACDEALAITRYHRADHKLRNTKRAQARSRARQRQRSAGILAALPSTSTQPENPGSAAPVAAEGSQAEDKFWDAVRKVSKGR